MFKTGIFKTAYGLVILATLIGMIAPRLTSVIPPVFAEMDDINEAVATQSWGGSLEDQLANVQKQLAGVAKQKQDLKNAIEASKNQQSSYSSQIRQASNERAFVESEIQEKQLTIEELDLQIQILTNSISDSEKTILATEADITSLQVKADKQLADMYFSVKTSSTGLNIIFADGSTSIVKTGLYQKVIQESTNSSLLNLKKASDKLKADKQLLESNKIKVQADKSSIDQEKILLDQKQKELQSKISYLNKLYADATKSIASNNEAMSALSDQEAKLLAQAELIQQQIFKSGGNIGSNTYVVKNTQVGVQGLTGLTTGYHLHFGLLINGSYQNPCGYLPTGQFSNCGGNGQLAWPMRGNFYYTSAYGYRNLGGGTSSFHAAIDIANSVRNAAIYAAHDGWLFRGFEPCSPSNSLCKPDSSGRYGAHYVIICQYRVGDRCDNGRGMKTLYWHLAY